MIAPQIFKHNAAPDKYTNLTLRIIINRQILQTWKLLSKKSKNIGKIVNFQHRNKLFIALELERTEKFYSPINDLEKSQKNIAKFGQFEGLKYNYLTHNLKNLKL